MPQLMPSTSRSDPQPHADSRITDSSTERKKQYHRSKQRICAGAAAAVATTMGINKGKGAPRRLETCWPDIKNQWRLLLDGKTIVAGTLNQTQMQLDVEIAEDVAGDQNKAREIAHCIREWERSDRIGYLLFPQITMTPSLRDCDYGRAPGNLGKGIAQHVVQ